MQKLDKLIDDAIQTYSTVDSSSPERDYQLGYIEGLFNVNYILNKYGTETSKQIINDLQLHTVDTWREKGIFNAMITAGKLVVDNKKKQDYN